MPDSEHWWEDTFAPLLELSRLIRTLLPSKLALRWPRLNFITIHYLYIMGCTIVFSVILYGQRNMEYIDALFFAGGTATQSGLNTIDVNLLKTYQQVVFYIGSSLCTPIFINTAVVFVRLYWFEQRFSRIVKDARLQRRTRTFSRSKSQMAGDKEHDGSTLERGVNGRKIQVMPETMRENGATTLTQQQEQGRNNFQEKHGLSPVVASQSSSSEVSRSEASSGAPGGELSSGSTATASTAQQEQPSVEAGSGTQQESSTDQPPNLHFIGPNPALHRNITFADEVPKEGRHSPELARESEQGDIHKHIEFIERQQANAKKGGALYIPGPRDFDQGKIPEQIDQDNALRRQNTRNSLVSHVESAGNRSVNARDEASMEERPRRGITIDVPNHPGHRGRSGTDADHSASSMRDQSRSSHRGFHGLGFGEGGRSIARTWTNLTSRTREKELDKMPYLSWQATTGRNSAFLGLSEEQREELGGIEYRALKTLAIILLCYFFGFHVLGVVVLLPWIRETQPWRSVVESQGQSAVWWGIFTPASMFNDLGFTLTNNSMVSFNTGIVPLLFGSFLIVIGNTGFPCMLRFIIWLLSKITTRGTPYWDELRFLLDHPRRCFTLLFPSKATWWLFWVLLGLNSIDLIFFIVLDLGSSVLTDLSTGFQVLNGWFQAVSTRTAGFASVNLAELHAAIQVSYLIMMYISVFPIAISVRRTNVYEEKSLGIFGGEEDGGEDQDEPSYVSQHLRRQLSFDLWYIFLGLFIIAIVEGDRIANTNQYAFTTFSVLFEIVSAYGTVGLSLGYPSINASFSGEFRVISKLIIIAMMIRGRHRGLPYALDRAILLPSEKLHQKEQEDAERRLQRRGSAFAEGIMDFTRSKTWEDGDLDENGLPKQHTGYAASIDPMLAGAGGADPEPLRRLNSRRSTALSTRSQPGDKPPGKYSRSKSLAKLVAGGLSAGPTISKHD